MKYIIHINQTEYLTFPDAVPPPTPITNGRGMSSKPLTRGELFIVECLSVPLKPGMAES